MAWNDGGFEEQKFTLNSMVGISKQHNELVLWTFVTLFINATDVHDLSLSVILCHFVMTVSQTLSTLQYKKKSMTGWSYQSSLGWLATVTHYRALPAPSMVSWWTYHTISTATWRDQIKINSCMSLLKSCLLSGQSTPKLSSLFSVLYYVNKSMFWWEFRTLV